MTPPEKFGIDFLHWFKTCTESYWSKCKSHSQEFYKKARVGRTDWQPGTLWLNGLSLEKIETIQNQTNFYFPSDYKLFLETLHATDRPMICAQVDEESDTVSLTPAPGFCNWISDFQTIMDKLEEVTLGLEFDVEHNGLWLECQTIPFWGELLQ